MVSDIFLELVRLNPFQKGIACRNRSEITDFMENFQNLVKKWQKMAKNRFFFSASQAFFHPTTEFFIPYALYTCPESGIWPGTLNSKIEPTLLYNIHMYIWPYQASRISSQNEFLWFNFQYSILLCKGIWHICT